MDLSGIKVDRGSIDATLVGIKETESRLKEALRILADSASKKMITWAKEHAKWTDRTGNARQRMEGHGYWEPDGVTLTCAVQHCVSYGTWLELAHAKKYAILEDAIESHKDELISNYKKLVGG